MQLYSKDGVRMERTNWRCQAISSRHRHWGYNCPAVDLDFMVAEYNHGVPVALIEYKERHAFPPDLSHATYRALSDLANNYRPRPLPFLIATYDPVDWWFIVTPVNDAAHQFFGHVAGQAITEQRFVTGLYKLRSKILTDSDRVAIAKLNLSLPEEKSAHSEAA